LIVRKEEHKDNYSVIDNEYLRRGNMSLRAMGLLTYLLHLPDDWVIHKSEVQSHFPEGRGAFNTAFDELVDKGYIIHTTGRDDKGHFKHYYDVYEIPKDN